jgi:epoxyqueuosine reductase
MNNAKNSRFIKDKAIEMGFDYCGIARATRLDQDAQRLEQWLNKGMHGSMLYMDRYFDLRVDPAKLVPGAKSVITLMLNYLPAQQQSMGVPKISKYAYGKDYHEVIRNKMKQLLQSLKENIGEINGRGFVDSAPVLERSWAVRSGLGWIGKNGNLLTKTGGSFLFIATLITDLELDYDDQFAKDYCGTCRKCIDACPTGAILEDKIVNGSKCISYFTIELKDLLLPDSEKGKFEDWIFGCDICQDVCPWNRFAKPTNETEFSPLPEILNFSFQDWEELKEESFSRIFRNSPLKRAKFNGIKRNLSFIRKD